MCQVGVADSSAWHLSAVELRANWNWRIWVDTDDKPPCEDDCSGVTRRDQTADRGRRWCREGRDERQKQEKELWETITQPNNYSFVRILIIFHQKETFLILLELMILNTSGCMPLTKLFTWISSIITQWWIGPFYLPLLRSEIDLEQIKNFASYYMLYPNAVKWLLVRFCWTSPCAGSKIIVYVERTWPLTFLSKEKEVHQPVELSRSCCCWTLEKENTMSRSSGHIVEQQSDSYVTCRYPSDTILTAAAGEEA